VSKWAGKYVIGLTGNIGTGKSVVRRMLEHLGAYGIDADALAHRAIARGAPGYQPVVEMFGRWVLAPDGQINRSRLGKVVFSDPQALTELEKIVHPLVSQAIDLMVRRASQPVIVIEAIKLLESGIADRCDSVWAAYAPLEVQLSRLMKNRQMSEPEARQRIEAQPPQEQKLRAAKVVIKNAGSFEDTWRQVQLNWQKLIPQSDVRTAPLEIKKETALQGEMIVVRARPRQSAEIAELMNRLNKDGQKLRAEDVMAAFGEKAFLLLQVGKTLAGWIGWQVENLVARTTDIKVDPALPLDKAIPALITEMERASKDLQCEASLVFVQKPLAQLEPMWHSLGYELRTPQTLGIQAWQEAAQESMPSDTSLLFKQLRKDRILRPI
jgi:dephospho-CoA kinase